jgi:hypothetical protein
MPAALAQFWPMQQQAAYGQVPGYGYSVMPGAIQQPIPWFRQPLPYFQQPTYPFMSAYPAMGSSLFPQVQPMGPFQMNPYASGIAGSPYGMQRPGIHLGLNFNLDQLFGGGNAANVDPYTGWPAVTDAAPVCEECERRRADRIRLSEAREEDEPDYHTEARARYSRQASNLPQSYAAPQNAPPPPNVDPSGDRIANGSSGQEIVLRDGRRLPPAASPQPRPNRGVIVADPRSGALTRLRVRATNHDEAAAQNAPIWNLFITNFKACAADCEPVGYLAEGRRGHPSCHNGARAIDVHGMRCSDGLHMAIHNDSRWATMIACMGGVPGGLNVSIHRRHPNVGVDHPRMGIIWRQPLIHRLPNGQPDFNIDHWDHAHFTYPQGCGGGRY